MGVDYIKYDQCDYIHDPKMTAGGPDLDKIVVRKNNRVISETEAEAAQNRLKGMARVKECERCSGEKSISGIGYGNGGLEVDSLGSRSRTLHNRRSDCHSLLRSEFANSTLTSRVKS